MAPLGAVLFDLWMPPGLSPEETRELLDLVLYLDERNRAISETFRERSTKAKAQPRKRGQRAG